VRHLGQPAVTGVPFGAARATVASMYRKIQIVVDCADPAAMMAF
jgi:hypothetical protein